MRLRPRDGGPDVYLQPRDQDEGFYNVLQQPEPSSEVSLTDLHGLNATPPEGSTSLTKYVSERGPPLHM